MRFVRLGATQEVEVGKTFLVDCVFQTHRVKQESYAVVAILRIVAAIVKQHLILETEADRRGNSMTIQLKEVEQSPAGWKVGGHQLAKEVDHLVGHEYGLVGSALPM